MEIKILGPGCPRCKKMAQLVMRALAELDVDAYVLEVHDPAEIAKHTMMTPSLVVDGQLVATGVVSYPKIKGIIEELRR